MPASARVNADPRLIRLAIGKRAVLAALLAQAVLAHAARDSAAQDASASSDSVMARLRATMAASADSAAADTTDAEAAVTETTAPDSSVRVTGARLRFGVSPERVQTLVPSLAPSRTRGKRGETVHEGELLWFGQPAAATFFFRDARLARVRAVLAEASPRTIVYIEDQLRISGFKRSCELNEPTSSDCEWRGSTVTKLVIQVHRVEATIEPAPRPKPKPPPPPRPLPEVFVLEKSGVTYDVPLPEFAVRPAPVRPASKAAAGVMGRVWVRSLVDTSGAPLDPRIVRSIAPLDSSAIAAARITRFKPYVIDGVARSITVEFPVVFTLN